MIRTNSAYDSRNRQVFSTDFLIDMASDREPPQVRQKEQGDDEAQGIDETFVDA
jgi:hypothetical protein